MYRCAQQPNKLCSSWHEKAFKSDSYLSQFFPLNIFNQLHFCFGGHRRYTCSMHPVSLRLHGPRLHRSGHYLWIKSKFPITEMTDFNQLANVNWNVFLWQLYRSISVWPLSSWYENMIISQHVSFFKTVSFSHLFRSTRPNWLWWLLPIHMVIIMVIMDQMELLWAPNSRAQLPTPDLMLRFPFRCLVPLILDYFLLLPNRSTTLTWIVWH